MRSSDWSSDVCSSDLDIGKARFGEAMARLQQAETILGLVADVRVKLDSTLVGWARGNLDDMQAQLAALVPPGFLRDVPASALAGYPRYLQALAPRAPPALHELGSTSGRERVGTFVEISVVPV